MRRVDVSPWIGVAAAVCGVLIADLITDSFTVSLLVAVLVGLVFAGISAVLRRRVRAHDRDS